MIPAGYAGKPDV